LSILGGGVIFAAWVGAFAQAAGYPLLLTTIGFGGLALSLALAGLSLRKHNEVGVS
jgi:sugar (pentulose or hexulose) kinase